jgi:diguanylate cyclase (GGDEF)-like protein
MTHSTQAPGSPTSLHDFASAVLAANTLTEVAEAALGRAIMWGFAQRALVRYHRLDGSIFEWMVTRDSAEATAYQVRGLASMTLERMDTWQDEIFLPDVVSDAVLAEEAGVYEVDLASVICLPLEPGTATPGGLYLDRGRSEPPFAPEDLALARHYALLIGHACRALDRQETGSKRQDHLESLLGIFRTVAGVMEISTLLDHVTQKALAITKAERAFILLVEGQELTYGAGRDRDGVLPATSFKQISHSVCRQVLEGAQEVCVFDAGEDAAFSARQSVVNLQLQGIVAVPLIGRDGLVGILYIDSSMRNLEGLRKEMKLLRALGSVASLMIENAQMYHRVTVDAKTGLFTHALLTVRLEEEISRARRYERPCAVLLIGLDALEEIAEEHGADRAAIAMRLVAQIMRTQARGGIDFPARYGDDRLALVLPETPAEGAWTLAERVREKVGQSAFAGPGGVPLALTVSVGLALWQPPDGDSVQLLAAAEAALEDAWASGGNCSVLG